MTTPATAALQDYTIYVGDAAVLAYTVVAANGNPIDISSVLDIVWTARKSLADPVVLTKKKSVASGITFVTTGTDGQFQINLANADTSGLSGYYFHLAYILDSSGNQATVMIGRLQVGPAPSWTYDPAQLQTEALYQVRFFLGDTDVDYQQLADEEINFALLVRGSNYGAAAMCAQALVGKYSRLVNTSADGMSQQLAARATAYAVLSREYEQKEAMRGALPYAGGISQADMCGILANCDRVPDIFRFGAFDNPPSLGISPEDASGFTGANNVDLNEDGG